jgi:hypothetical protein
MNSEAGTMLFMYCNFMAQCCRSDLQGLLKVEGVGPAADLPVFRKAYMAGVESLQTPQTSMQEMPPRSPTPSPPAPGQPPKDPRLRKLHAIPATPASALQQRDAIQAPGGSPNVDSSQLHKVGVALKIVQSISNTGNSNVQLFHSRVLLKLPNFAELPLHGCPSYSLNVQSHCKQAAVVILAYSLGCAAAQQGTDLW